MVNNELLNPPLEYPPQYFNEMLNLIEIEDGKKSLALCRCWNDFNIELLGGWIYEQ